MSIQCQFNRHGTSIEVARRTLSSRKTISKVSTPRSSSTYRWVRRKHGVTREYFHEFNGGIIRPPLNQVLGFGRISRRGAY